MSFLSELFSGATDASNAQINGINTGLNAFTGDINTANSALSGLTQQGLSGVNQNSETAQLGVTRLDNLLGLNGASGSKSAQNTLKTMPGYQFALGQGNGAVNAAAAASGTNNSGGQQTALSNFNQGLASQNYNNYVSQLQPYMGLANSSAGQTLGAYENQAGLQNQNYNNLANTTMNANVGIGNAQASADLANQSLGMNLLGGGLNLAGSLFSDERLKEGIEPVGKLYDGQEIFRYKYIDDPLTTHIGLIAQDAAMETPDAVSSFGGFLAVDYGKATDAAAEFAKFMEAA